VFLGLEDITLDKKESVSQISSYYNFLQGMDSYLTIAPAEVTAKPEILLGVNISSESHFSPVSCHKRSLLKYSFLHMLTINILHHDDCYQ
jgi:hypothetical protein